MNRIKADGIEYEIVSDPSMGELRRMKRYFGVNVSGDLDPEDIDVICGFLFIAMNRAYPTETDEQVIARVDSTKVIEAVADDEDEPPAPKGKPAKGGR